MTEEESKKALFELHKEYMSNPPKKRLKLYSEYMAKRNYIKEELMSYINNKKEKELVLKG